MPAVADGAGVSALPLTGLAIPDLPLIAAGAALELGLAELLPGVPPAAVLCGLAGAVF